MIYYGDSKICFRPERIKGQQRAGCRNVERISCFCFENEKKVKKQWRENESAVFSTVAHIVLRL